MIAVQRRPVSNFFAIIPFQTLNLITKVVMTLVSTILIIFYKSVSHEKTLTLE